MKNKVIIFISGLLLGAIIATGAIYIYTVAENNSMSNNFNDRGGQMRPNDNMGNPPEMPQNNN